MDRIKKINTRNELKNLINFNSIICEIGVKNGEFFKILTENNPKITYAIDIWDLYQKPSQNDLNYTLNEINEFEMEFRYKFPNTNILKMTSYEASFLFSNEYFDFIYIDADHTYQSIKNDLNIWYPKIKIGGILAGHDYFDDYIETTKTSFGVIKAVNEFVKEHKLSNNIHITNKDKWESWIIKKYE